MPNPDGTPTFEENLAAAGSPVQHLPKDTRYDHIGANGYIYHMIADGFGSGTIDPSRPPESSPGTKPPTDHPAIIVKDRAGNPVGTYDPDHPELGVTPLQQAPTPTPQAHTYTPYTLPNGQPGVLDSANGTYHPILGVDGQPITDPVKAAQAIATLNATTTSTANSNVQTGIAVNTDARNNAIYNRDTTHQQVTDDAALEKQAFEQGRNVASDRLKFQYDMPRNYVADLNQARQYQNQDAERMVTAATQRQTAGQTAGNSAFERAKYMAENSIGPQGVAAMRGAAGGAPVNPGQFVMPMPRFEDIFGGARSQAMQEIPTYGQAQAQTPPYQTFQPNYDDIMAQYNQYISPYSAVFGPRPG